MEASIIQKTQRTQRRITQRAQRNIVLVEFYKVTQ